VDANFSAKVKNEYKARTISKLTLLEELKF
jgi:hypothetical protein